MEDKKINYFLIFTNFCLSLCFISCITYMISLILYSDNLINNILSVIGVILLAIFSFLYMVLGLFASNNKVRVIIIIGTLLLSFLSLYQSISIIKKANQTIIDFTGMDIQEVIEWANERDILIEQQFIDSDDFSKYKVISQDVKKGSLVRKNKKITVVVSDGASEEVETEVTSMIGWMLDDVLKFIDDNHLTNVNIEFEFNNDFKKDTIFYQDVVAVIKRNEAINLKCSLGKESELKSITMKNIVGMDLFHATIYLERNYLNYRFEYQYSENLDEGTVLKQSIKQWDVVDPKDRKEIIVTIAKKNQITVPDLRLMSLSEVNTWAANNRLKLEFTEEFDDTIKLGNVISFNPSKNSIVSVGDTINIVLSKGVLRMTKFTNIDEFINWASENGVIYKIDYEYNDNVTSGKLISTSHKENQIIKNDDTVHLVISQGGNTTVPNLIGMTKKQADEACLNANIICKYKEDGEYVIKQSMRGGSKVPDNTTITLTLGSN